MSNFKPGIEFLIRTKTPKDQTWHETSETHQVGTPWAKVRMGFPESWTVEHIGYRWPAYAWPGGYQMFYVTGDVGILCPDSANKELPRTMDPDDEQFYIIGQEVNWDDPHLYCDHCNKRIPSCYSEDSNEAA